MAIQSNKIMNLEDGQVLYNDLRRRIEKNAGVIEEVINTPSAFQTFDDGADGLPMALTVGIDPVQDLHGYDHPWPAGGGKNLYNPSAARSGQSITRNNSEFELAGITSDAQVISLPFAVTANETYTISFYAKAETSGAQIIFDGQPDSVSGLGVDQAFTLTTSYVRYTKTGTIDSTYTSLRFYRTSSHTGASGKVYIKDVQLEKSSSATDFAPYSNICPISGWTGAKVTRTGRNIFDEQWEVGALNSTTGENYNSNTGIRSKNYISVFPNTAYYGRKGTNEASTNFAYFFYDKLKNYLGSSYIQYKNTEAFTTPANAYYMRFSVNTAYGNTYNNDICINFSDASFNGQYVPSDVNVYDITFPSSAGTVYGGTLTVNKDGSGELVVDRAKYTQNDATNVQSLAVLTNVTRVITNFPTGAKGDSSKKAYSISNYLPNIESYTNDIPHFYTQENNFITFYPGVMTGEQWLAYVTEHPLEIVYPLATPVTYTLTAEQVKTLLGVNNLFADCGSITEVRYPADTKLYIDKKFAELSAAITALQS